MTPVPCYGVVVAHGDKYLLLHQSQKNNWSFPKGHADPGEEAETTARRELKEEAGITEITLLDVPLIREEYEVNYHGQPYLKVNQYYVGRVENDTVDIQQDEILGYVWVTYEEAKKIFEGTGQKSRIAVLDEAQKHLS
jgi:bis(5'-nucleosidyl)-tetraphosphatase